MRPSQKLRSICALSALTQSCGVKIPSIKAFTDLRRAQPSRVLTDIPELFINTYQTKYRHIIFPDFLTFCLRCRVYFRILREQSVSNRQS